ncbi:hypothetical protein [Flavobacterium sp.]|uniref:hypothetical protein n=1 Tax=Flavobacterium sp. TaxID=239 RepID=UPI00404825F5
MKKRIAIFSGLIYSDRYFIYSDFPDLIKNEDVIITIYTNVKSNCVEFEKKFPNHPNLSFSYFNLKDLFYHKVTFFIRRLNDKLYDKSFFGSKTRKYFTDHMYEVKRSFVDFLYSFFLFFNSTFIRSLSRKLNCFIHLHTVKKNVELTSILKVNDVVVLNWSYNLHNQSIAAHCLKNKTPFFYHIQGFDNITTKPRFIFKPKGILTWSKRMNNDILRLYPEYKKISLNEIGNIQFDILKNDKFQISKKEFLNNIGFDENKFTITFGLGSPNLFQEEYMLLEWLANLTEDLIGEIQIIVRPHPAFKINNIENELMNFDVPIHYQNPNDDLIENDYQSTQSIKNWINTIQHSDLLINTSSTLSLDFSFFDKPVININYDSSPGMKNDNHIKAVQNTWEHFVPIINHNVLYIVNSYIEINDTVTLLLEKKDSKNEVRKKLIRDICLNDENVATANYIAFLNNL